MKKSVQANAAKDPRRRISSEVWMWVYIVSLAAVMILDVYLSSGPLLGKLFPVVITYGYVFVSLLFWKDAPHSEKWPLCNPRVLVGGILGMLVVANLAFVLFGLLSH